MGPAAALYAGGGFGGAPCHAVPAIVRPAFQPSGKKASCKSSPLTSASSGALPARGHPPSSKGKAMAVLLLPHTRMRTALSRRATEEPLRWLCL